jgi:hypothetical protein
MDSAIEYRISLKYVEASAFPVKRTQKLAEFCPVFIIRKNGKEERVLGKPEARTRVFLPDFVRFAVKLGAVEEGTHVRTADDYAYLRLMIYGVLMSVAKNPVEFGYLEDLVLSMEPLTLRFWSSKIKYTFWRANRRALKRLAKHILAVERLGKAE